MRKITLLLFILVTLMSNSQNYISFGGAIVKPLTDVDYETGAELSISYKHTVNSIIFRPNISIIMMSGIDNQNRRERKYQYQSGMTSIGLDIQSNSKFYGVIGIHYNYNLIDYKFNGQRLITDKTSKFNQFSSQYIGLGYHSLLNYELGLFYTNTNYLDGYYPLTSKHNDMYIKLTISYDIPLTKKCPCRNSY